MNNAAKFGIAIVVLAWVALCWVLLDRAQITLRTILVIAISGILVIVPLVKKYGKKPD